MSVAKVFSILCSATGAVCVVFFGASSSSQGSGDASQHLAGVGFIFMQLISVAFYFVLQKDLLKKYSPCYIVGVSYLIASFIILPLAHLHLHSLQRGGYQEWTFFGDRVIWTCCAYGIVLTTAFNYVVLSWANTMLTPTTVTSSTLLQPLFGAIIAWVFFDVMVTREQAIGGIFILVGLTVYARSLREADAEENKVLLNHCGKANAASSTFASMKASVSGQAA
jgi:drug/metabolite transporter (DMT)-like permease